jgi:hypothetical protein
MKLTYDKGQVENYYRSLSRSKNKGSAKNQKDRKNDHPLINPRFKLKRNANQWIRDKDVDTAIYYPDRKIKPVN